LVSVDRGKQLYRDLAEREARLEMTNASVERQVIERTEQLRAEIAVREAREEELRRAQFAAEGASRAKSQFLANMSHEIRTPMNGVLGFTNLLLDTPLNGEQHEHVRTIRQSGESLLNIINDILDFSKVEAGRLTVERIPFDLRQAAEEVVELLSASADQKGLDITLSVDSQVPQALEGDPGRVRQVLTNLVGNALKFTNSGEVSIDIRLTPSHNGPHKEEVRISVTDTGIGIPPEKHALLFEEFSQADGSTTRQFGGTGLGLAICRGLVETMGGRIGLTSEMGKGSCFWFTLPCSSAGSIFPMKPAAPERVPPIQRDVQLRVLVAEDNTVNQRLVKRMLEKLGCRVDIAADGREALKLATELHYDILLMDCSMPRMDGFQATAELRRLEKSRGRRRPVIALTANAMAEDRERCLNAGMDDYLSKPVRIEDLRAMLERWAPPEVKTLVAPGRA